MNGLSLAEPVVLTLEKPVVDAFPVEKTYYYHRRHYYHPYYHRRYYHHNYHRHYYHRRYW